MRRRTWVLVGTAAFVLLGGGVGVGVAAARYDPLEPSSIDLAPGAQTISLRIPGFGSTEAVRFSCGRGGTVQLGVTVLNTGGWTVHITSVATSPESGLHPMLTPSGFRVDRPGGPLRYDDADTTPFAPFDLHPGEDRLLFVHLRLGNCAYFSPGNLNSIDELVVHFSFLGFDHRTRLPLDQEIQAVDGPVQPDTIPTP
jgi:hypothetical protein